MMNLVLRAACIAAYVLAVVSLAGLLPPPMPSRVQIVAAGLLTLHAFELALVFRHVRLYRGPLAVSVLLTLLFGLLHWKPLVDASRAQARAAQAKPRAGG